LSSILPNAILRKLSGAEMAEYRRPFAEPGEGRRPTLTWPRQIPVEGEPADVHAIATEYADWLGTSNVPPPVREIPSHAVLFGVTHGIRSGAVHSDRYCSNSRVVRAARQVGYIEIATIPMVKDPWKELNPLK
jgi:hypothetical protein